jgi:hypothetical protein
LSRVPTETLLADLRGHHTLMPNFVLLALAERGHDIRAEVPVILDLLASDDAWRRNLGWAAMTSAFPDVARRLDGYSPAHDTTRCRTDVQRVRRLPAPPPEATDA